MSVNAYLARGTNPGAGLANTAYQMKVADRNAYVQDRAFEEGQNRYTAQSERQATADQMAFGQETLKILSDLPPEQRQVAYMARVEEAAATVGLPEGFDPIQGWQKTQAQLPPYQSGSSYGNTVFEGVDDQGNRIFAQPGGPSGFRALEGIRPPGPSAKDVAAERKAKADARVAETKAAESEYTQEQKELTKNEVQSLAAELLDSGAIESVYGSLQGAIPSVRPGVVDAEAQVDRLVDMLTLENTSKMTGVLSESDIKILARAGSVLANKRISDSAAKAELKRIAGVLGKVSENKVGRFTVEEVKD